MLRMPRLPILQTLPPSPPWSPPPQGFHGTTGPACQFPSTRVGVRAVSAPCYTEQPHRQEEMTGLGGRSERRPPSFSSRAGFKPIACMSQLR